MSHVYIHGRWGCIFVYSQLALTIEVPVRVETGLET